MYEQSGRQPGGPGGADVAGQTIGFNQYVTERCEDMADVARTVAADQIRIARAGSMTVVSVGPLAGGISPWLLASS